MIDNEDELARQEKFIWARSVDFSYYNGILGYYQAQTCLQYAHGTSLLDMPCGDGTLTAMMAPHFKHVVGVDASITHLNVAKQKLPQVEFHHNLIENLQINEKFDTITMLNVLEHVTDPAAIIKKAAGFLKKNGVLIIHVPNAQAVNRKIAVLMGTLESCEELSPFDIDVVGHRRSYDLKTLCMDIDRSGLKLIASGGVFYKMLSTPQMDWFLKNGLWEEGGFGWGRIGEEKTKDWRKSFCDACYEFGKQRPKDCNVIYAVCKQKRQG
jgi:SAM-dependent methyltransferase